jgi:uncharacterized protein (DUF2252 family)
VTSTPVAELTPAQRAERGRAARRVAPRSAHGDFAPSPDRADPLALLRSQDLNRVAELVPIRYQRMRESPFAFFRGSALVMAADLAKTPASGIEVQLCGDAHLGNFGLFGSPERQLVFDINDFDETLPGPWEWDVKRLATSIEIVGRTNGFNDRARRAAVIGAVAEYRRAMREFAGWTNLAVWYAYVAADSLLAQVHASLDAQTAKQAGRALAKARSRDHLQVASRLVTEFGGDPRFVYDPPLLVPISRLYGEQDAAIMLERVRAAVHGYRNSLSSDRRQLLDQFRLVDVARKVVGVGSVGIRAWVALLIGRDIDDPLILQVKEAQASVLERFVGPSRYANAGQRVVAGQRVMQASGDILLGWQRFAGFDDVPRDFYVRQLRDWKGSVDVDQMSAAATAAYGQLCAWTLARAHARSGDRIAIAAYLGEGARFDEAIARFARGYADQNEADHRSLVAATGSAAGATPADRVVVAAAVRSGEQSSTCPSSPPT